MRIIGISVLSYTIFQDSFHEPSVLAPVLFLVFLTMSLIQGRDINTFCEKITLMPITVKQLIIAIQWLVNNLYFP